MKTWKAKYAGYKDTGHGMQHHFYKKDGGQNGYNGNVTLSAKDGDWCEITVDENNGWQLTAAKVLPAGGGKGKYSQPYHPETFVSNVVGSAIQAGAIKEPAQLREWAAEAFKIVKGMQAPPEQKTAQNPPPTGNNSGYNESNPPPYNDDIPW